jgi:hypothetical protein
MVDREQFNKMSFKEKCSEITFNGKLLASKQFGNHQVFLFWLKNFYVELWFNNGKGEIHGINSFETAKGLDFYLDDFSIQDLRKIVTDGN